MKSESYQAVLKSELERRQKKNPGFSLRAFARVLKISPAHLSKLMSGKKSLTAKTALTIAESLAYSPLERTSFVESTLAYAVKAGTDRQHDMREEEFRLIADWYHFAILSLSELKHHKSDPRWIASQLEIPIADAARALTRLEKLGLIEIRNQRIRQLTQPIETKTESPSAAIRTHHRQNLDLARRKIEEIDIEDREFSSITMAISRKKLPKAKKLMHEFKRQLADLLENGEREAVYTLSMQLFPISKLEKK